MPLVYLGTGWFIGIALASALHLPIELLLLALLVPIIGLVIWRNERRTRLIWFGIIAAVLGGVYFTLRLPHFDQNSLSTYNGVGIVTIDGVIDAPPDVRDTYINLRVNAERLTPPNANASSRPIEGVVLVRPSCLAYAFRDQAYGVIQQIPSEPQASLLSGILLGIDSGLREYPNSICILKRDQCEGI